ncbi:MAG: multicopper oxidase family protein [Micromonosporaceae bacterium]
MVSRRRLLELGVLGGGALLLPSAAGAARPTSGHSHPASGHPHRFPFTGSTATVTPFSVRMPLPPVARPSQITTDTDVYQLDMRPIQTEIIPGYTTAAYGYGGSFIGPTIHARKGRRTAVVQTNRLSDPTAVHVHGGHTPASSDGYPMDVIAPGKQRRYEYPNLQPATTMWYHDHAHHHEAEHVYRGLAGFYLLHDPDESKLGLPHGEYDVPIMLRDAQFASDGSMVFVMDDFENRETVLVNGRPQPYFPVAARKYRLRILNATNLRGFQLRLSNGQQFTQIGSDGGLLAAPYRRDTLKLYPGERIDVVVDFSRYPVGTQLVLENSLGGSDPNQRLMRFDVVRTESDDSRVPDQLATIPALPSATNTRAFALGMNPATFQFQINGMSFDPNRIDARIKRGTTEIWRITNLDTLFGIPHNFHVHLVQFKVLDRDGRAPGADEAGWKDTVSVDPGETVRIQATFGQYTGKYVYHCHMIDHSAGGMMGQMEVVP